MKQSGRNESLTVLLANGHTYDIDAAEGNNLLKVLFDTSEPWMRFSTVDGKVINISKDAIIALENPKPGHPVTTPTGFSTASPPD